MKKKNEREDSEILPAPGISKIQMGSSADTAVDVKSGKCIDACNTTWKEYGFSPAIQKNKNWGMLR